MSQAGDAAKVCFLCSANVTDAPRVKDRAGRYLCQPCYERALSARSPGAGAPSPVTAAARAATPISLDAPSAYSLAPPMPASEIGAAGPCPDCGMFMGSDAVVCTSCGFNRRLKRQVQTHVRKAEIVDDEDAERERRRRLEYPLGTFAKPALLATIGYGVSLAIIADQSGSEGATIFLAASGINLAMGVLLYYMCALLWVGIGQGFRLVVLNFAGIYGAIAMLHVLMDLTLLPGFLSWIAGGLLLVILMMDLLDLDSNDAIMVAVITFVGKIILTFTLIASLAHWLGD